MANFQHIPADAKIDILQDAGEKLNLPAYAVEKDWWVVQTLAILFEMEVGQHMVFKGGTSLSKAWGIIDRFSEDIDLAVDRKFYGFEGTLGKKERTLLRKKANSYITDSLYPEMESRFKESDLEVKLELPEKTTSDQDPIIIHVYYPNVIESPGYLKPSVQVEIGCRSMIEPYTTRAISSMLDDIYPAASFTKPAILIPTVDPERTLLEKIFLLHEEFQRIDEKIRVDRMSRHLYDIYKLTATPFAEKALENRALYTEIVLHRQSLTKLGGVDYKLHNPVTINPIPPAQYIEAWEQDYQIMREQMIYTDAPSFRDILVATQSYVAKINQLDWIIIN